MPIRITKHVWSLVDGSYEYTFSFVGEASEEKSTLAVTVGGVKWITFDLGVGTAATRRAVRNRSPFMSTEEKRHSDIHNRILFPLKQRARRRPRTTPCVSSSTADRLERCADEKHYFFHDDIEQVRLWGEVSASRQDVTVVRIVPQAPYDLIITSRKWRQLDSWNITHCGAVIHPKQQTPLIGPLPSSDCHHVSVSMMGGTKERG